MHEPVLNIAVGDPSECISSGAAETEEVELLMSSTPGMLAESAFLAPDFNMGELGEMFTPQYLSEEIAPTLIADEVVVNTSEPLAQEVAEIVGTAPILVSIDSDTSTLSVHEVAEVVEIVPAVVADSGPADTPARQIPQLTEEVPQTSDVVCTNEEPLSSNYLTFYGLSEQPFQATPDPAYLYLSQVHLEALSSLSQGIHDLRGFMALIAEPGMGKTTLLNKLMEKLRGSARTVLLFQTQCNSRELLRYLLNELGVETGGMDVAAMHRVLNEVLFREMLDGRRFVLIVDEAQNLHESVLETIRLLSDFETAHRKLIQIVLAGQPQLVDTLMRPSLLQLRQRIAIVTNLVPLSATETCHYVEHRLRAAGLSGDPIFTPEALALIAERSQGTPRSINNLCFDSLRLGYAEGARTIDSKIVQTAAGKLDLESLRRPQPQPADAQALRPADQNLPSQLANVLLAALARETQTAREGEFNGTGSKASVTLSGKLTEKLRSRSSVKGNEFRIQVSLERESSPDIPVADRYYCCSFYIGEEQAAGLRAGQRISIKIE